jgi:hypothetical protein
MIISLVIIQCSSVSEKEFRDLKEEIGVLKQDFYNDLSLKNLKTEVESLNYLIQEKEMDFNEGKFFFKVKLFCSFLTKIITIVT